MPFKFNLGPPQITINDGWTVFVTELDGNVPSLSEKGLYLSDTRIISEWGAYINGQKWDLRNSGKLSHYAARFFLVNQEFPAGTGLVESNTLELVISRYLGHGMHEDLDISNYGKEPVRFRLQIAISSDFVDLLNLKLRESIRRGKIESAWSQQKQRLRTTYQSIVDDSHSAFNRELILELNRSSTEAAYIDDRITFEISLPPGEIWHTCLLYTFGDGERYLKPSADCVPCFVETKQTEQSETQRKLPSLRTDNQEFRRQFDQALCDAMALRFPGPGCAANLFFPAGGLPWFATLFGRDSLIASMQFLIVDPDFARGTLEILGSKQGTKTIDFHDEQPGRILHELRFGELSHSKSSLFTPYYGTADASILYLIALHATWMATGDAGLLERHLNSAERCLEWIDDYGDPDRDGLQEYHTANSSKGYENLGWKDSPNAVLHPDGTPVKGPKALCELQGYVYDAWLRMAEIDDYTGNSRRAEDLRQKASTLRCKFDKEFWDEEIGCYSYALDGEKRKVLTLTSNVGHCLWSGIVPVHRAERVVKRLMEPDMSTGWGIRTCSAHHLAFNPYSYHNGSVWPHDNSLIAAGFIRYGFINEALKIVHDVCDAATHFQSNQLPEFYAGVQRSAVTRSNLTNDTYYVESIERLNAHTSEFPILCSQASVPQAWAAGSTVFFLQSLLGIEPDAPHGQLYIDPHLPLWLPELTLENLAVGAKTFTITFRRSGFETLHDVYGDDALEIRRGRLKK